VIEYADLQALSDAGAEGCWRSKNTVDAKEAGSERCSKEGRRARGDRREVEERVKTEERDESIPMVRDTVKGFTAVIFQHEIDHLDGILYIDRL
jgi:peptide deformylase